MTKADRYLKMKTPADLLTVRFFSSSGQLKGQFLQEQDPPWTIWWQVPGDQGIIGRIGSMLQGSIEAPEKVWEEGTPGSALRQMAWLDLFRKSVVRAEDTRRVADEVILMTADREVFFTAVRKHFMLQQGQVEFAVFTAGRDYYLLKISNPSLWVFNTLAQDEFTWFNVLSGHSGIYMEAGWRIHDISGPECFNQFKIVDGGILLIQKDGRLLNLKPSWKKGESIIKIETGRVDIPEKNTSEGLSIKPGLRKTDRHQLAVFWKVEDLNRLKAIVANESLKNFRSYRSWYCADGRLFILAKGQQADRALATILSDAFAAFAEVEEKVLVPVGHLLTPRLSSDRLHKFFGAAPTDYLCFEQLNGEFSSTMLAEKDMLSLEDFVALEIERAAAKAEVLQPGWKFEFKELKKKKQLIEVEISQPVHEKLRASSDEGQVASGVAGPGGRRRNHTSLNLEDVPVVSDSEASSLKLQLENLDRQLNSNATRADLWQQRGEVTRRMRMKVSAIAGFMNAAILNDNIEQVVDCVLEFCREKTELAAMLKPRISELEKGRLLLAIRSDDIHSEFHYALLLVFGAMFNDRDIFNQAVAGMKNGFSGQKRGFYNFNEIRVASGGGMNVENRVELLTERDMTRIEMNCRKFLLQVGCCSSYAAIVAERLQLNKMLSVHLSEKAANSLVPVSRDGETPPRPAFQRASNSGPQFYSDVSSHFISLIKRWPESASEAHGEPAVSRWLKLLSMEKIKETPLRDFFTGELYRPPFHFNRREEESLKNGLVKISSWLGSLNLQEFPEICDGKPIARAIYQRFSDGRADWSEFFRQALRSDDFSMKARSQRLLLLMVSEFGPHPDFAPFIVPLTISSRNDEIWDIYRLTMYCDMFRLCLAYRRPIDEQRLFNMLINRIPQPPSGWEDFIGSAEWIIMCLLLTSSPVRRFQLDNLTARAMKWLSEATKNGDDIVFAETMTVLSFLGIGILADLVPEKLELHQLLEKRRVFWIQHAFSLASHGDKAFNNWQSACGT